MRTAEVRAALRRAGVRPSRRLGQHFLVDSRVADRHVDLANPTRSEVALEVGPGLGVLTRPLAGRAGRVVAVEKDRRLAEALRGLAPNVEIIQGDALRVPWPRFDLMVANLPFQISSPLTFALLDVPFDRAFLMYQREFAERLTAEPATSAYSRLTVHAFVRCASEIVEEVPRSAFYPPPGVDSAIVRLRPRKPPFAIDEPQMFRTTVDAIFAHRRKTIGSSLRLEGERFGLPADEWKDRVDRAPFLSRRAQELTPEEIAGLAASLAKG